MCCLIFRFFFLVVVSPACLRKTNKMNKTKQKEPSFVFQNYLYQYSFSYLLPYLSMCTITVIPSRSLCCSVLCSFFFCVVVEFFADLVVCVVCFALCRNVPVFLYLTVSLSHYLTVSLSHYLTFTLLLKHCIEYNVYQSKFHASPRLQAGTTKQ